MRGNEELSGSISVTEGAIRALDKTRAWVLFLGVMGVIGAVFFALFLLAGIGLLALRGWVGLPLVIEGAVFLVLAGLFATFWFGYSGALQKIAQAGENTAAALDEAFVRQHRLWVLQGVIVLLLVVLAIAAAVAVPIFLHTHPHLLASQY